MVQESRGHAAIDVWANGEAALWSVSLVCGAEEIALLRVQGYSMQEVARRLQGEWHRQSPESCGATPPPEAAASRIVRRQRNGTPSALLAAQSRRSLRATRR